jgi:hypothetical protein
MEKLYPALPANKFNITEIRMEIVLGCEMTNDQILVE